MRINESKKSENGANGTKFEAAVVKTILPQGKVQYTGKIEPEIIEDARLCAPEILNRLNLKPKDIASISQIGQHTSSMVGDISLTDTSGNTYSIEMKYIQDSGTGTWHNPSINVFVNEFPDMGFITPVNMLNTVIGKMNLPNTKFQVSENLMFMCDESMTVLENLECLCEPFSLVDEDESAYEELELINYPQKGLNSPLGNRNDSTWAKIHEPVFLTLGKDGNVACKALSDDDYENVFSENEKDEYEAEYSEKTLYASHCWKIRGKQVMVSPAEIYDNVLKPLGKYVVGYIGRKNFEVIMKDPELPTKVLSLLCDKKESSGLLESGKRPDFLVIFKKGNKSTSIFDCKNFKAGDSDKINFVKNTENRYTIGNANIGFTFQYAWRNGAFSNPVLTVQLVSK